MGLFDLFKRNNNQEVITTLEDKVAFLEKSLMNNSMVGIEDGNYINLGTKSENVYRTNYTVYRGINMLADMIAQLPLRLYRGDQELPEDFTFPNGFSLSRPNTAMSLNELLYVSCVFYFFYGEFINHIIVNDGIMRLSPINPKEIHRNSRDGGNWRLRHNILIPKEELLYIPLFNPTVAYGDRLALRGMSPIDVIKAETDSDSAAGKYITKFFENFAQPGGTLIDKNGTATPNDMERMVGQFNLRHQSQHKAYNTIGLPNGIEYIEPSQTMREMQFLDSRKDIRDKILAVLGIHKALFGVTDQVNRSVIEEATRQLWVQTLKPKTVTIQEKFNQQFFNVYFPGYRCKFDLSDVAELQENMENILKQAVEFKKLGYTTNEINEHFNLKMEPITDEIGDMRFVPIYLRTLEQLTLQTPNTAPVTEPKKAMDKIVDIVLKDNKSITERYRQVYLRKRNPLEIIFRSKIKRHFFEQRKVVLNIVNTVKHPHNVTNDLNKFFNAEDLKLQKTTKPLYVTGAELGIELVDIQLKMVTNSSTKDVVESTIIVDELVIMERLNKIVGINHTVYNQIKLAMFESLKEGETLNQLAKKIKEIYNFAEKKRCITIARTEVSAVVNDSTASEYKKKGVKRITWCGGTRATHAMVNGDTVNHGEEFKNGLRWPGDNGGTGSYAANLINCRCCMTAADYE